MRTTSVLVILLMISTATAGAEDGPVAQVKTVPAEQSALPETVTAYGTVTFPPEQELTISLPYAVEVTRLRVGAGQAVRRGTPLFDVTPDPGALLAYQQAQNATTLARQELKHTGSLLAQRLATRSELDAAKKALRDAEDALRAQQSINRTAIEAPFDGVVMNVSVAQGERIAAGAAILQLGHNGAPGGAYAVLGVEPTASLSIRRGMPVTLKSLDVPPGRSPPALRGSVDAVRSSLDPRSRLVDVVVEITDAAPQLMPGIDVVGRIVIARHRYWVVPRSAVLHDQEGDYLFQVTGGKARRVAVVTRVTDGDRTGVDGPLAPDQAVVSVGNYELQDGMAVQRGVLAHR